MVSDLRHPTHPFIPHRSGGFGDTISKLNLETLQATGASVHMEYRGKHYTIVQGIRPGSWKWTVELHERGVKSGHSPTREAAKIPGCLDDRSGTRPKETEAPYPRRQLL